MGKIKEDYLDADKVDDEIPKVLRNTPFHQEIKDIESSESEEEEEIVEFTGAGGGSGAYEGNFGALRKSFFKSNVPTQLTKEQLLRTLNENKMSVGEATESYRNAGLILQHFKKEQQAVLDHFKSSDPEEKNAIKPVLIYYHNLIEELERDLSIIEKEMDTAMGAESDDDLVMESSEAQTSSGEYSQPSMWVPVDKNWKPKISKMTHAKKPFFRGGKFVKVKETCKSYPYCNQGDINALELTDRGKSITESIHKETGMGINYIKSMIIKHMSDL